MNHARRFGTLLVFAAVFVAAGSAANQPRGPTLKVSVTGSGRVATSDGRIECTTRCSATYRRGKVLRLQATPEENYEFVRWSGDCIGAAPICELAVDRKSSVRAQFVGLPATLVVSVGGPGRVTSQGGLDCGVGSIACYLTVPYGSRVTLQPVPGGDGRFGAWDGPCASAGSGPCTLRIASARTEVAAAFGHRVPQSGPQPLSVRFERVTGAHVASTPAGIDCPPTCEMNFPSGTLVTLSVNDYGIFQPACTGTLDRCLLVVDAPTEVLVLPLPPSPPLPPPRPQGVFQLTVSGGALVTSTDGVIRCGWSPRVETACREAFTFVRTRIKVLRARMVRRSRFSRWGGVCAGARTKCKVTMTRRSSKPVQPFPVTALFRRR
jgi:List-Bact-rpt repeat protein